MNDNEKLSGNAIHTDSKALGRIENFWYHYKWPTIIVSFFAIVAIVCTLQICNRESYDITAVYAGPCQLGSEQSSNIQGVLNYIMPEDFDGDGEKNAQLINYLIYSKEQVEKLEAESSVIVDRSFISNENQNFFNYAATEAGICFIDPSIYETLKESDRLMEVTELLGEAPEGLIDNYGVRLSDTGLYKDYAVIRELPADTVVCILRKQLTKKDADYQRELDTFKAIISHKCVEN